jgi:acetyl esterase/lipase
MKRAGLIFLWLLSVACFSCSDNNSGSSNSLTEAENEKESNEEETSPYSPSSIVVYKTIGGIQLTAHIFNPVDLNNEERRPALVYFHGGGWFSFTATAGYKQCDYFASMGMVAISFEYRLSNLDDITPVECITDAKSALRWTREHADELHIDPDKIVAAGGSAGGHLAAATAILEDFDEANEDTDISASPNAMILFSAAVNTVEDYWFERLLRGRTASVNCSPYHHVRQGLPPTILFHGTSDMTVAFDTVVAFKDKMIEDGNRCELYPSDSGHMFHLENDDYFVDVMELADSFLASIGFLSANPSDESTTKVH